MLLRDILALAKFFITDPDFEDDKEVDREFEVPQDRRGNGKRGYHHKRE